MRFSDMSIREREDYMRMHRHDPMCDHGLSSAEVCDDCDAEETSNEVASLRAEIEQMRDDLTALQEAVEGLREERKKERTP